MVGGGGDLCPACLTLPPWSAGNHTTCVEMQAPLRAVSRVALLEDSAQPSQDDFAKGRKTPSVFSPG